MISKYGEIIRYLFIGVLTTLVSLLIYYGLVYTFLDPNIPIELQIANIISWLGAVTFAFFTNHFFVFRSQNKNIGKEMISFTTSRVVTLLLDMFLMFMFVTVLSFNDKFIKLIVQVIVIIINYILSKIFVFKKL